MYSFTQTVCTRACKHVCGTKGARAGRRKIYCLGQSVFCQEDAYHNNTPPIYLPGKFDKF